MRGSINLGKHQHMIPVLIMSCARDQRLALLAAQSALAAGADRILIVDDPDDPCTTPILGPGLEHVRGLAKRNGNLNGPLVIMEIMSKMKGLAMESESGVCLKLDSDTVILSLWTFLLAPHGRNRDGNGAFFGAAYSLDIASLDRGIAEWQSDKIQPSAPEDLAIWGLCGSPIAEDGDFALAPVEIWQSYPTRPAAVTCGNPLPDGQRRSPSEIEKRMRQVLTN